MTCVAHVITGLGTGGAETMLAQLATGLQAKGMAQHVVCLKERGAIADRLEQAGIPVTTYGVDKPVEAMPMIVSLARLLARLKPDVVQGWMYHGNLAAALATRLAGRRSGCKLLWNIRASNMDAERYSRIIGWNARLSHWPDLVIANSQAGMGFHMEHGFRPKACEVIPNGIDIGKFAPDMDARNEIRKEWGVGEDDVVALHVARVDPMKDHTTCLKALAEAPQVKGVLVGLDTDRLDLPPNVRALGLRDDIPRLCAAADIMVSSSAYGEGFSNALAEGMSAGLVPVTTRVGDSGFIADTTGEVVEPCDPAELGAAIGRVAALSPAIRRRRGLEARKRIERNFSLDRAISRFAEIYDARLRNG